MVLQTERKRTQRGRLLEAIVELTVQDGYPEASIARIIALAGVSRPTFYEYFSDREACLLDAYDELAQDLLAHVSGALASTEPQRALYGALGALVEYARIDPRGARFVMHEPTTIGGAALDAHDKTTATVAQLVQAAETSGATPDLGLETVIGSVQRLLALRLRRGERGLTPLTGELEAWLESYERPGAEQRWRSPAEAPKPDPSPFVGKTALYAPPPLPSGRAAPSEQEISHNHRERILHACVTASNTKGYGHTSVADIAKLAKVDKRIFYRHFKDKQDAFHATLEYGFQQSVAATATAFFSAPTWPERVWQASAAFTQFLAKNEGLATFAFTDAYTIGPTAVHRLEDLRSSYKIFLQEGLQHPTQHPTPNKAPPTDTALEAIAATVFQVIYQEIRKNRTERLDRVLPQMVYLCLTPFLGIEETERTIERLSTIQATGGTVERSHLVSERRS